MDWMSIPRSSLLVLTAGLGLAACGGGGGGDGGSNPPPSGNVTVSGTITFDRPSYTRNCVSDETIYCFNFSNLQRKPIRGATVEILRASDQSVLASTTSSATGSYSATIASTSIIVRVKAQMQRAGSGGYDFEVRNNTSGNALYSLDSSRVTPSGATIRVDLNAPTGWGGTSYTGTRAAGPFAILDMLWEAKEVLHAAEPALTMPALEVYWSPQNNATECVDGQPNPTTGAIGTTFYLDNALPAFANCPSVPPGIYVLGDADGKAPADDTDEFDSSVIAHELAHYFQDKFSRDDSTGGPHFLDAYHDASLAFSEGWGNAFQGFVLKDNWYRDTFGAAGDLAFAFDMENDTEPYGVLDGFYAEASIHEFLWDVYDGTGEFLNGQSTDAISLGYGAIHEVMRSEIPSTAALTTVFSFSRALEQLHPAQQPAIRARLAAEDIVGTGDFAANQLLPDRNELLFEPAPLGAPVVVTSSNEYADHFDDFYQSYNRLGARRFLRIDAQNDGQLTVVVQGLPGSDPDLVLYRDGVDQCPDRIPPYSEPACLGWYDSTMDGREEATFSNVERGATYVLEVFECSYLGEIYCGVGSTPFGDETTFTVTVTQP